LILSEIQKIISRKGAKALSKEKQETKTKSPLIIANNDLFCLFA